MNKAYAGWSDRTNKYYFMFTLNHPVSMKRGVIIIAHRISHETIVVVVNNQSANSKEIFLLFDWMLATTFASWDFLWAMVIID